MSCLESKNAPFIEHLLQECNLIGRILEAENNYKLAADLNKVVMQSSININIFMLGFLLILLVLLNLNILEILLQICKQYLTLSLINPFL